MNNGRTQQREGFRNDTPPTMPPPAEPEQVAAPAPDKEKAQPATARATPPPTIEPSPAELPPLDADQWPLVVKLLRPIHNDKGELLKEITLREPKALDINRYGNPVRFNAEGDVVHDERKMTYMIAALSGILVPFIEQMDTRDWNTAAYKLRRFFLPDLTAW